MPLCGQCIQINAGSHSVSVIIQPVPGCLVWACWSFFGEQGAYLPPLYISDLDFNTPVPWQVVLDCCFWIKWIGVILWDGEIYGYLHFSIFGWIRIGKNGTPKSALVLIDSKITDRNHTILCHYLLTRLQNLRIGQTGQYPLDCRSLWGSELLRPPNWNVCFGIGKRGHVVWVWTGANEKNRGIPLDWRIDNRSQSDKAEWDLFEFFLIYYTIQ